jgi:shikimate dehydrogenase
VAQQAKLTRFAVFGSPVKHSLSPRIHQLFAEQAGIPVEYEAIEVTEDFLSREVQKLADSGGVGCNITSPLKNRAFQLANQTSDRAEMAQSANTLIFHSETSWSADSTDGPGLIRDLVLNLGMTITDRRVCIVGAGGAAAGVIGDLLQQKPSALGLYNRTIERAQGLADRFREVGQIDVFGLDEMRSAKPFDLIINATSSAHKGQPVVLDTALFGDQGHCYDMNYGNAHDGCKAWCNENSIKCHDGLGMLIEQAAESFQIWTGFRPDTGPVHQLIRNER